MSGWPILSTVTFLPVLGIAFLLMIRGDEATVARNARQVALWSSIVTFALSLVVERSIFRLGVWSFTGFAALFPLFVAALAWRRATAAGAWASLATAAALFLYYFVHAAQDPGYTLGGTGFMPVGVIVPAAALALVVVSLVTRPPSDAALAVFFPERAP